MARTAGLVRADGASVTTAGATDKIVIQTLDAGSGQYEPRLISVANLITGGGVGLAANSVVVTSASGDLDASTALLYSGGALTVGFTAIPGSITILPTTAANGSLKFIATNNASNFASTLTNAAVGQATVYTLPDPGAATANIILSAGTQTIGGAKTFTSDVTGTTANFIAATAGKGFQIKEGSNARMGTATLVNGTVTISNTSVTANTRIFLNRYNINSSTALGLLSVGTVTGSTSFVINALKEADATVQTNDVSIVHWVLVEPAA
jgi:hypothetical protein